MLQPLALIAMVVWAWPAEGPRGPAVPPSGGMVVDSGMALDAWSAPAVLPAPSATGWRLVELWLIESEEKSGDEEVDPEGESSLDLPRPIDFARPSPSAYRRWRPVPRSGTGGCIVALRC